MKSFEMVPASNNERTQIAAELKDGLTKAREAKIYINGLINDLPKLTNEEMQSTQEYKDAMSFAKDAVKELQEAEASFETYRRWVGDN